ncbi:unnamed protein product [Symbiodinium natans]|uniref:Uncharacterized protein n=1 Tax=Symbiodinium natans TaxID=878477 RepID=A0A812PIJ5_9DINO|nr:unnamed protein product [Symbiodinium natans]
MIRLSVAACFALLSSSDAKFLRWGECLELTEPCGNSTANFVVGLEYNLNDPTDLITVVDLNESIMIQCRAGHLEPTDSSHCPDDNDSLLGQLILLGIPSLFLGFALVFFGCRRHPNVQFWVMLVAFWTADLGAGLATGMYAQMFYPTGATTDRIFLRDSLAHSVFVDQLGVAFIFELLSWDWPMQLLKQLLAMSCWPCHIRRTVQGGVFLVVACVLGTSMMYMAVDAAYRPASIVVVGHHPLILGFVNFALDLPWKFLERRVKEFVEARCWPENRYEHLEHETHWLVDELADPLPDQFVADCRYASCLVSV